MTSWLSQPIRSLRETMEFGDTPKQLAMGIALGLVIGLVPKGNFMCIGLCLLAVSTRVNLGTTMLAAIVFSLVSPFADPLTHRIGLKLLTWELAQPVYDILYGIPFVAWTAFNDTVVMGSLALGLSLSLPTYWLSKRYFERSGAAILGHARSLSPTASRSYVASTSPLRVDAEYAFESSLAMAAPTDLEEIGHDEQPAAAEGAVGPSGPTATRRLETAHRAPAPLANNYPSSESSPTNS